MSAGGEATAFKWKFIQFHFDIGTPEEQFNHSPVKYEFMQYSVHITVHINTTSINYRKCLIIILNRNEYQIMSIVKWRALRLHLFKFKRF